MQYTTNYSFKKPEDNEAFDQQNHANWNMDQIDAALTPTADPAQVPTGNGPGKLVQWVSWFANRIKAITGKANWWDAPDTTLAAAKSHIDAAAPHSGHALASDLASHLAEKTTHGVGSGYYIAKTSRTDQNPSWNDMPDKPSTFTPSAHTHAGSDITSAVARASDSDTVDGAHAGTGANNVLLLDSNGKVPLANIPSGVWSDVNGPRHAYKIRVGWDITISNTNAFADINKANSADVVPYVPPNWKVFYHIKITSITSGYTATLRIDKTDYTNLLTLNITASGDYYVDITSYAGIALFGRISPNSTGNSVTVGVASIYIKESSL